MTDETSKKTITLDKFRSWLEGVEEMQEPDWHPTASQWKTIRDKFDLIEDKPTPVQSAPVVNNNVGPLPQYRPPVAEQAWVPPPVTPPVEISPAAKALLAGNGGRTKTPDVDSTDGKFESPFT